MNSKLLRNLLFGLVVIGYLYYCYQYIQDSSVPAAGGTYYVLFDDAMISMRYAYNLAHGLGAVWNAGEYVEGFTNPLWVGIMALVHLLPIPLSQTSLVIQVLGALLLTGDLYFVRRIVEHFTDNLFPMLAAAVFTAFYAPLNSWGLLGMEVSLLTLMLSAAVWMALRNGAERFSPWIYVLLGVSTLVRFDMTVPYLVILAVLFYAQKSHRRQNLIWGLGLLVLFLGAQTVARYLYYGELLPNTYYLKVAGWPFVLRILRGLYAAVWFIYYTNWVLFLLPLAIFLYRRDWQAALLALILAGQLAYSVYVGGDAWEEHGGANRYIAIAMPLYFAGFAVTVDQLLRRARTAFVPGSSEPSIWAVRAAQIGMPAAWALVFVIALLNFNLLLGDWKSIERWDLLRKPDYVAASEHNVQIALALQNATQPGASVAVIGAGTIPYLLPDRYAIDILGKGDAIIAHERIRAPMSINDVPTMRPGHMKWDYAHTFGELQPDVIVSIWEGTDKEAEPYLKDYVLAIVDEQNRIRVYLRKDSPRILWDQVIIKN